MNKVEQTNKDDSQTQLVLNRSNNYRCAARTRNKWKYFVCKAIIRQRFPVGEHKKCIHYWHHVFGQRHQDTIKSMCSNRLVDDMVIENCGKLVLCEIYTKGKLTRIPFPK